MSGWSRRLRGWQINKMIFIGKNLNEKQLKGILVASTESDIRELKDLQGQPIDFLSPNALGASVGVPGGPR